LAYDQRLFHKIVTLINHHFNDDPERSKQIVRDVIFPALSFFTECNNPTSQLVWNIMKRIDFKQRYAMYTQTLT
jgi:hypothetical protein